MLLLLASLWNSSPEDELLEALQSRHARLRNVIVNFEFTESFMDPPDASQVTAALSTAQNPGQKIVEFLPQGVYPGKGLFKFSNGASRFESDSFRGTRSVDVQVFAKGRAEHLWQEDSDESKQAYFGSIHPAAETQLPRDATLSYALGLRLNFKNDWLTEEALKSGKVAFDAETKLATVTFVDPEQPEKINHRWTVDPAHAYRLVRYDQIQKDPSNNIPDYASAELENLTFETINGIDLPKKIQRRRYAGFQSIRYSPYQSEVDVISYSIGDASNTEESMLIEWPEGASIIDYRTGAQFRRIDHAQVLTDEMLAEAAKKAAESNAKLAAEAQRKKTNITSIIIQLGLMIGVIIWLRRRHQHKVSRQMLR